MPYRSIEVERFEELADGQLGSASGDPRPPPATEKEDGCIRQDMKKLSERIPLLCGVLGQQMPAPLGMDIGSFWQDIRKLGSTGEILILFARELKTSLLRHHLLSLPAHCIGKSNIIRKLDDIPSRERVFTQR